MNKIDISKCTNEDQVNLVLKLFGAYFKTDKTYDVFAYRVQTELILSLKGWANLLCKFRNK